MRSSMVGMVAGVLGRKKGVVVVQLRRMCVTAVCMCWPTCVQDGDAVNKLGAELMQLFSLHSDVYQLAMEGSKASSKRGRKAGAAAAEGVCQVSSARTAQL